MSNTAAAVAAQPLSLWTALIADPYLAGVEKVTVIYSGGGDEGSIDDIEIVGLAEGRASILDQVCSDALTEGLKHSKMAVFYEKFYSPFHKGPVPIPTYFELFQIITFWHLQAEEKGWEIDDGSSGFLAFIFDKPNQTISLEWEHLAGRCTQRSYLMPRDDMPGNCYQLQFIQTKGT